MPDHRALYERLPIVRELRDELEAAYETESRREDERRPRRAGALRQGRHRVPLAAAAALAVAVAATAVVATLPAGERGTGSIVDAAAAAAARQAPAAPEQGGFAHFRERGERGSVEWWVAADGSGRVRQTARAEEDMKFGDGLRYVVRPGNDPGLPRWERTGDVWVRDTRFGPGSFPEVHATVSPTVLALDVDSLPANPAELEAELRRRLSAAAADGDPESGFRGGKHPTDWEVFVVVEQALAHPLAPPELRAALYEVAGGLEGVEAAADVTDPAGRPASMLRLDNAGERTEVFFDPDTAELLARRITYPNVTDTRVYTPPETVRWAGRTRRGG
jgi:hypothetical protein